MPVKQLFISVAFQILPAFTALRIQGPEELCDKAHGVAANDRVLLFVGDVNMIGAPAPEESTFAKTALPDIKMHNISNVLVIALDDEAYAAGEELRNSMNTNKFAILKMDIPTPGVLQHRDHREQQSAKKFPIIKDLLKCGVDVLLSDVDVVYLDNPMKHIIGDADIEAMSDGWDDPSIYGFEYAYNAQESAGWPPPWEYRAVFLNSGFFFVRRGEKTSEAMDHVWLMLQQENIWDQAAFNLQVRAPLGTNGRLKGHGLTIRIMDPHIMANSRIFAQVTHWQHLQPLQGPVPWPSDIAKPVVVHANYHKPHEKLELLNAARNMFR